jgi:AcrR family transcriptional regulator
MLLSSLFLSYVRRLWPYGEKYKMQKPDSQNEFRTLDKSLRRQKIIDTAAALFHKQGYRSTSLDDVSKELGITKAAIYHYVSSKEKLLSRIYIQALENIFRNTYKIAGKDLPPDATLRLIIQNHIKGIIIQSISMFSVFFTEENQLPQKEFKKILDEKKKYTQIVEKIIEDGISQGIFRKADPRLQANAIIGMCNWVYKWYKPGKSPYTPDQIADHFVSLLETGYLKTIKEDIPNPSKSAKGGKRKTGSKKENYRRLRNQCMNLLKLVDEMEKSG